MLPVNQIYEMFRDGKSYTEIAVALRLNRNTVAGAISKGRRRGENLPKRNARDSGEVVVVDVYRQVRKIKRERLPDTLEGIDMIDTNETHCREIIGHLRCCGKPVVDRGSKSYCEYHAGRNYA